MKRTHFIWFLLCVVLSVNAQDIDSRLTGTPIGSAPVNYGSGYQIADYAFDNDPNTYYASDGRSNTWVGLDLGKPYVITHLGYMPRKGYPQRVQLGVFEGSNSPDFLDAVPLYVVPGYGKDNELTTVKCDVSRGFRYVRYVGPNNQRCNIAEVAFWGNEGDGDSTRYYQISDIPTLSIHIYDGSDPSQDKLLERECNMTLTYDHGTRIQEYPMTIRGRGNASWGFMKKPYRIKFNDGKKHHMLKDSPRESPAKAKKWTLLSNEGDKTLMRNLLAHEVSRRLELPYTVYSEPVDLILNGEYKGLYNLCDQVDENKNRVPITEMEATDIEGDALTGGYHVEIDAYSGGESPSITFNSCHGIPFTIKSPDEDVIQPVQREYIRNYWNEMERLLWSNSYDDPATGYQKLLDLDSFLRFFLLGEMSGNTDTFYSTHMWKDRNDSKFYTSPGWDFDLAFENDNRTYPICQKSNWVCFSNGSFAGSARSMVERIVNGPNANKLLKQIWSQARKKGAISEESLVHYLDSMEVLMTPSADLNFKRWDILNQKMHMNFQALGSYPAEVNVARQYIIDRVQWIDEFLGFQGGDDPVPDSTYYISTPNELVQFANDVNKGATGSTCYLIADLNMNGVKMPIIGTERHPFQGEFDGQGHTISNLHITGTKNTGLIGAVGGNAYIHDFVLDNTCSIQGSDYVGIIGAATNGGNITIERVGNEATITGGINTAGIIGCNYGSNAFFTIRSCYNIGEIHGSTESGAISGWVGNTYCIERCWNAAEVWGYENGRELFRYGGWGTDTPVYSTFGRQGVIVDPSTLSSGELCWLLNDQSAENPTWFQKIGVDTHPMFDFYRGIVYKEADGTYSNGKFLLGDANVDGKIDMQDFTLVTDRIMGRPSDELDMDNADTDNDGEITVFDLVQISNLIRGGSLLEVKQPSKESVITSADGTIKVATTKRMSTMLQGEKPQAIYQVDVLLPEGITTDMESIGRGTALTNNHMLDIAPIEGGYRIVAYAVDMDNFTAATATAFVLKLLADASFQEGKISFTNQHIATADNTQSSPETRTYTLKLAPTLVTSITPNVKTFELTLGTDVVATIEITVLPETATDKSVTYRSEAPEIVSVDSDGIITALMEGSTKITITANDGSNVSTSVTVTVLHDPTGIEGIETDKEATEIYDVSGIRVSQMQRGRVYIINGKRVIIK